MFFFCKQRVWANVSQFDRFDRVGKKGDNDCVEGSKE